MSVLKSFTQGGNRQRTMLFTEKGLRKQKYRNPRLCICPRQAELVISSGQDTSVCVPPPPSFYLVSACQAVNFHLRAGCAVDVVRVSVAFLLLPVHVCLVTSVRRRQKKQRRFPLRGLLVAWLWVTGQMGCRALPWRWRPAPLFSLRNWIVGA